MAGRSSSRKGSLPNRAESSAQAEGAPGTVTGVQPYLGTVSPHRSRTVSRSMPMGAGPLPLRP